MENYDELLVQLVRSLRGLAVRSYDLERADDAKMIYMYPNEAKFLQLAVDLARAIELESDDIAALCAKIRKELV